MEGGQGGRRSGKIEGGQGGRRSGKIEGAGTEKKRKFQGGRGDQPCHMLEMLLKENED